jgi:hypothetical protein
VTDYEEAESRREQFRQLFDRGLVNYPDDYGDAFGEVQAAHRQEELPVWHGRMVRSGAQLRSILQGMIREADDLQPRPQETYRDAMDRLRQADLAAVYGGDIPADEGMTFRDHWERAFGPGPSRSAYYNDWEPSGCEPPEWGEVEPPGEEPGGDAMTRAEGDHFREDGVW